MKTWALLSAFTLGACAAVPPPSVVVVQWVRVADPDAVCRTLSPRVVFFRVRGCATWAQGTCVIYAPDVRAADDRERLATLGHEVKHCFDGAWHDAYGNASPKR